MDQSLQRYLNDHLAGSAGAVHLIEEVADHFDLPEAKSFFLALKTKVEADREVLARLVRSIDKEPSGLLEAAGKLAAKVGDLKFSWEGINPGELGMFEALEMLTLGVQGKRLLWQVLDQIRPSFPEWAGEDFATLKREAGAQRDGVDFWRLQVGGECLVSEERRKSRPA